MEILFRLIIFILLIALLVSPILILNRLYRLNLKNKFVVYFISSIIITFCLFLLLGWWGSFSNEILLSYYGYNFDALNDAERFKNVAFENIDKVKELKRNSMGIGWPLKVFMTYCIYFPYLIVIFFVIFIYKKRKKTLESELI